jgi:hypothetical protein
MAGNNVGKSEEIVIIEATTERRLEARHLSMIAIGGAVGTGLFLNSGTMMSEGEGFQLTVGSSWSYRLVNRLSHCWHCCSLCCFFFGRNGHADTNFGIVQYLCRKICRPSAWIRLRVELLLPMGYNPSHRIDRCSRIRFFLAARR